MNIETAMREPIRLRDGTPAVIRPIVAADADRLGRLFDRLGPESRRRRFLAATGRISDSQLSYLAAVDQREHGALIAVREDGTPVGVVRYVRDGEDPRVAEVAVAVADDCQHLGAGTALLKRLGHRATAQRVRRFRADVLAENAQVVGLLRKAGRVRAGRVAAGVMRVTVELDGHEPA